MATIWSQTLITGTSTFGALFGVFEALLVYLPRRQVGHCGTVPGHGGKQGVRTRRASEGPRASSYRPTDPPGLHRTLKVPRIWWGKEDSLGLFDQNGK